MNKYKLFFRSPEPEAAPITVPLISITHPSDVLDMPVDPNEPTYCLCHQVSYGEMIGCDNADVSIQILWFDRQNDKSALQKLVKSKQMFIVSNYITPACFSSFSVSVKT